MPFSRLLLLLTLLLPAAMVLAQGTVDAPNRPADLRIVLPDPNRIYEIVTEPAAPVGGLGAFNEYLLTHLVYPASAVTARAEGVDSVEFVVETDGTLTAVALRGPGVHPDLDAEALRVVRAAPAWTAAHHRGNVVRQRVAVAVRFAPPLGAGEAPPIGARPVATAPKARRNAFTGKALAPPTPLAAEARDVVADQPPRYPDGPEAFLDWIRNHQRYPEAAIAQQVEGEVQVECVVDTDGTFNDARALTKLGAGLEEEALRLLRTCPDWTPARYRGKPIRALTTITIPFALP